MHGRVLAPKEVLDFKTLDKNLMKEFCKIIRAFDRVIVYWGKDRRHDLPFLRTRCLKWNVQFPFYREVYVNDCYDIVKAKLRLHRNRMQNACNFLNIASKQHFLRAEQWQKAKLGNKKALKYVWEHNKEDVQSLKQLYEKLKEFTASRKLSI